jgi:hypothetical protein
VLICEQASYATAACDPNPLLHYRGKISKKFNDRRCRKLGDAVGRRAMERCEADNAQLEAAYH